MQIPIESLNLMMLNVGLAHHFGDWNWQDVSSPFIRIFYVVTGEAWLHVGGKAVRMQPHHLYVLPAYTEHSYECNGEFTHYYLHVYEGVKSQMNLIEQYELPTEVKAEAADELLFASMCSRHPDASLPESDPNSYDTDALTSDYMKRYRDMAVWEKMELRGAMLMLFSRFMRQARLRMWVHDERTQRVLSYIHSHIASDITIDELASVACVTKHYFIRLFKHELGTSPMQYVNRKKIERAQLLLYTTDEAVKKVAYSLGFSDHSYFIRLFRKLTGITPHEYRKRLKG